MAKNPAYLPGHVMTVGGLLDAQERVIWSCRKCKDWALADLLAIQREKGPTYSLVDRTSTCRNVGCGGKVAFHYGAPARPCRPIANAKTPLNVRPHAGTLKRCGCSTTSSP